MISKLQGKNDKEQQEFYKIAIIEFVIILVLIVQIFVMMLNVSRIQGTARVVNYAGLVRGATQRLVKLEDSGYEHRELEEELDEIIEGLQNGSESMNLIYLEDSDYQQKLQIQCEYWQKLKAEVALVREKGPEETDIISMSETYFFLADQTVSAAEVYSQKVASRLRVVEITLTFVIICTIIFMIKAAVDIIRLIRINRTLKRKAYLDQHTGLPNKSRCEEMIKQNTVITEPTCVIMFDMNGLKRLNDTHGHLAGDAMIAGFADIVRSTIPAEDFVGRCGGDEFIAILKNITEEEVSDIIRELMQKVKDYNEQHYNSQHLEKIMSFACGYAISDSFSECTIQTLVENADHDMYTNKRDMHCERDWRESEN